MTPAVKSTQVSPETAEFRSMQMSENSSLVIEQRLDKLLCPPDAAAVSHPTFDKQQQRVTPRSCERKRKKVYGRQKEEQELIEAFDRCTQIDGSKAAEMVLITGPSGSGKSLLAQTLEEKIKEDGQGFWLTGKFDQLERPSSSYPIVRAITGLLQRISSGEWQQRRQQFLSVQQKLTEVANAEPLLVDWIPALRQFQSVSPTTSNSPFNNNNDDDNNNQHHQDESQLHQSADASRLLALALCRLIKSICSPDMPLVLFLDDIQWARTAPLEMLRVLVSDPELIGQGGFMLLTACQGDAVPMEHHLAVTLREMEVMGIRLTDINLDNLSVSTVKEMLGDRLHGSGKPLDEDRQDQLAQQIWRQSGGNALFTIQLIHKVLQEGQQPSCLTIQEYSSATELIVERIESLPPETRRLLVLASCFGAEFHAFLLQKLNEYDVQQALDTAKDEKLIERIEETSDSESLGALRQFKAWRFAHDQIQQSAYLLIDESEREETHLQIGRRLWNGLSDSELKRFGFAVVRQIRLGARLIEDTAERVKVADLLLNSGAYAAKASAFDEAAAYYELGISLLPPRHWRDEYFLSLALYQRAAQVAFCVGNHKRVEELTDAIFRYARKSEHKLVAYMSRIRSSFTREMTKEALDLALQVLNENGFKVPRKGRLASIAYNVYKTKRMLGRVSELQIRMKSRRMDETALHISTIISLAVTMSVSVDPQLFPIIAMKGVQRALKEGICGASAISFSAIALIMCCHLGDAELGFRMASLSLDIVEDTNAVEWLPQTALIDHVFVFPVRQSIVDQLCPTLEAHRLAIKCGDISTGMFSAHLLSMMSLHASLPLDQLINDMRTYKHMMEVHGQTAPLYHFLPTYQTALNLVGACESTTTLNGELMDEDEFVNVQACDCFAALAMMKGSKLLLSCVFGEYEVGEEIARDISNWTDNSFSLIFLTNAYLFSGIILATVSKAQDRKGIAAVKNILRMLKRATRNSLGRYDPQIRILEAEVDALGGKWTAAVLKYESAIELAQRDDLHMLIGIAHERVATIFMNAGGHSSSVQRLESASASFETWGATAKVQQLSMRLSSMNTAAA